MKHLFGIVAASIILIFCIAPLTFSSLSYAECLTCPPNFNPVLMETIGFCWVELQKPVADTVVILTTVILTAQRLAEQDIVDPENETVC